MCLFHNCSRHLSLVYIFELNIIIILCYHWVDVFLVFQQPEVDILKGLGSSPKKKLKKGDTLPETNSEFAPENGWECMTRK